MSTNKSLSKKSRIATILISSAVLIALIATLIIINPFKSKQWYVSERLVTTTYSSGNTYIYEEVYFDNVQLLKYTGIGGNVTEYEYNKDGHLTSLTVDGQTVSVTYSEKNGNLTGKSGTWEETDGLAYIEVTYNKKNQLILKKEHCCDGEAVSAEEYTYHKNGMLKTKKSTHVDGSYDIEKMDRNGNIVLFESYSSTDILEHKQETEYDGKKFKSRTTQNFSIKYVSKEVMSDTDDGWSETVTDDKSTGEITKRRTNYIYDDNGNLIESKEINENDVVVQHIKLKWAESD